eukprot:jgi/Chrzof1/6271/UNPLg00850.t1
MQGVHRAFAVLYPNNYRRADTAVIEWLLVTSCPCVRHISFAEDLLKYGLYSVRPALPESRSFQMVLEAPRCFQMFLDVSKCVQKFLEVSRCF